MPTDLVENIARHDGVLEEVVPPNDPQHLLQEDDLPRVPHPGVENTVALGGPTKHSFV